MFKCKVFVKGCVAEIYILNFDILIYVQWVNHQTLKHGKNSMGC